MIQDRLNDKEHDIQGVQKQSSELLSIAWQKGYQKGFNDGYDTRREADQRPQGEWIFDEKGYFYCNQCGKYPHDQYATTDFCCKCGADMRIKENSNG